MSFIADLIKWKVARYIADASGNVIGVVGPDGSNYTIANRDASSKHAYKSSIDWLNIRSTFVWDTVSIPSPYSPASVLHPSVVYFADGWNGYRYWMAYTPYPNSNSEYENPCVAASNDRKTWTARGSQPLVESPAGVGTYNSDTELYFDRAGNRMVLLYRETGIPNTTVTKLYVMTSTDGVTWTTPVIIYTSSGSGTAASTDLASPSIWYNDASAKWEIVGHRIRTTSDAWDLCKITSDSLLFGWDTSLTQLTLTPASGRKFWHSSIKRMPSGELIGLAQDNANAIGSAGSMYAIYSSDGTSFARRAIDVPITDYPSASGAWYRPAFVLRMEAESPRVEVFGSKLTSTSIFIQEMALDASDWKPKRAIEIGAIMYAAANGNTAGIILADNFNRTDDATGLGTSTSGHTYTQPGGPTDVVGILSSEAYNVTTGNCRALYTASKSDYIGRMTVREKGGECYMVLRYVDASNFIRIGWSSSSSQLKYRVITGGSQVTDADLGATPVVGDEIKVACMGEDIRIFLNDRLIATKYLAQGVTAATVGLQMSGTRNKVDNLIFTEVY